MHTHTSLGRRAARIAVFTVLGLGLLGVAVKLRYGDGVPRPDVSTAPLLPDSALSPLVTLPYPPGNVAVSQEGRVFFNYHPFAQAHRFTSATVFEWVGGAPRPFPDEAFQRRYQGVFGMTVDAQQRLWFIEPRGLDHERTRLLAFDLRSGALVLSHWFPAGAARFAQDLRVSPDGKTVYLADTGLLRFTPASIIVFDVESRGHRVVLAGDPSTQPQGWVIHTPFGPHRLAHGLITFSVGVDGIELSEDGAWLYYATMCHAHLFKVPTAALRDAGLSPQALAAQVTQVGEKPLSDGIIRDPRGGLLITDIEHGGLMHLQEGGALRTLIRGKGVIWADGVVAAPDGSLLLTDSAIPAYFDQFARPPSRERLERGRPYHIYRIQRP